MLLVTTQYSEAYADIRTGKIKYWADVMINHYELPSDDIEDAKKLEWCECGARETLISVEKC